MSGSPPAPPRDREGSSASSASAASSSSSSSTSASASGSERDRSAEHADNYNTSPAVAAAIAKEQLVASTTSAKAAHGRHGGGSGGGGGGAAVAAAAAAAASGITSTGAGERPRGSGASTNPATAAAAAASAAQRAHGKQPAAAASGAGEPAQLPSPGGDQQRAPPSSYKASMVVPTSDRQRHVRGEVDSATNRPGPQHGKDATTTGDASAAAAAAVAAAAASEADADFLAPAASVGIGPEDYVPTNGGIGPEDYVTAGKRKGQAHGEADNGSGGKNDDPSRASPQNSLALGSRSTPAGSGSSVSSVGHAGRNVQKQRHHVDIPAADRERLLHGRAVLKGAAVSPDFAASRHSVGIGPEDYVSTKVGIGPEDYMTIQAQDDAPGRGQAHGDDEEGKIMDSPAAGGSAGDVSRLGGGAGASGGSDRPLGHDPRRAGARFLIPPHLVVSDSERERLMRGHAILSDEAALHEHKPGSVGIGPDDYMSTKIGIGPEDYMTVQPRERAEGQARGEEDVEVHRRAALNIGGGSGAGRGHGAEIEMIQYPRLDEGKDDEMPPLPRRDGESPHVEDGRVRGGIGRNDEDDDQGLDDQGLDDDDHADAVVKGGWIVQVCGGRGKCVCAVVASVLTVVVVVLAAVFVSMALNSSDATSDNAPVCSERPPPELCQYVLSNAWSYDECVAFQTANATAADGNLTEAEIRRNADIYAAFALAMDPTVAPDALFWTSTAPGITCGSLLLALPMKSITMKQLLSDMVESGTEIVLGGVTARFREIQAPSLTTVGPVTTTTLQSTTSPSFRSPSPQMSPTPSPKMTTTRDPDHNASCAPTCYDFSCDAFIAFNPEQYSCLLLEGDAFGCDCSGCICRLLQEPTTPQATTMGPLWPGLTTAEALTTSQLDLPNSTAAPQPTTGCAGQAGAGFCPQWSPLRVAYESGGGGIAGLVADVVLYDGKAYECIFSHYSNFALVPGPAATVFWAVNDKFVCTNIAMDNATTSYGGVPGSLYCPLWDAAGTRYTQGVNWVVYDGATYACVFSHTSTLSWNPAAASMLWSLVPSDLAAEVCAPQTTSAPMHRNNDTFVCSSTCSGETCDYWILGTYGCEDLEADFGCDCRGCNCTTTTTTTTTAPTADICETSGCALCITKAGRCNGDGDFATRESCLVNGVAWCGPLPTTTEPPVVTAIPPPPKQAAAFLTHLESCREAIETTVLRARHPPDYQWGPSQVYGFDDFLAAVRLVVLVGIGGEYLYIGEDDVSTCPTTCSSACFFSSEESCKIISAEQCAASNGVWCAAASAEQLSAQSSSSSSSSSAVSSVPTVGLVNIAAFLAQAMQDSIQFDACDEVSWTMVGDVFPISNACGQGDVRSYQLDVCDAAENELAGGQMACEVDATMELSAATHDRWSGAPPPLFCGPVSMYPETGYWDPQLPCTPVATTTLANLTTGLATKQSTTINSALTITETTSSAAFGATTLPSTAHSPMTTSRGTTSQATTTSQVSSEVATTSQRSTDESKFRRRLPVQPTSSDGGGSTATTMSASSTYRTAEFRPTSTKYATGSPVATSLSTTAIENTTMAVSTSWSSGAIVNTCTAYEGHEGGGAVLVNGGFANRAGAAGRTDVEGCCYWGRGVLQLAGVCNFGRLNFHLGARAAAEGRAAPFPNVDFCAHPELICSSSDHPELKWVVGLSRWISDVQTYEEEPTDENATTLSFASTTAAASVPSFSTSVRTNAVAGNATEVPRSVPPTLATTQSPTSTWAPSSAPRALPWSYKDALNNFSSALDPDKRTFIDSVSTILEQGCHKLPCGDGDDASSRVHASSERAENFKRALQALGLLST